MMPEQHVDIVRWPWARVTRDCSATIYASMARLSVGAGEALDEADLILILGASLANSSFSGALG